MLTNHHCPLAGRVCVPLLPDEVYLPSAHSDDWDGHLMGSGINNVLKTFVLCEETWIVHWVQNIQLCLVSEEEPWWYTLSLSDNGWSKTEHQGLRSNQKEGLISGLGFDVFQNTELEERTKCVYFRWPYSSGLSTSLPCYLRLSCWPTMLGERRPIIIFHCSENPMFYLCRLVHSGTTTFESNRRIHSYNLGWRQNWREVMGYNWRMALVWPGAKWVKCHIIFMNVDNNFFSARSKLPHNGVEWDTQNTWRLEAPKNRWD